MTIAKLIIGAAMLPALAVLPAAAMAQGTPPEEIVVTGNIGTVPDSVRTLSQPVSYADLDLSTAAGRAELRHRVSLTARFLCDKLGEGGSSTSVVPSCRDAATRDAMTRVGTLEEGAAPRGTTWVRPPAWSPPYPVDWTKRYP